jgi:hypothetical protein
MPLFHKPWSFLYTTAILIWLVGCNTPVNQPTPSVTAGEVTPSRTARPTFTPQPALSEPTSAPVMSPQTAATARPSDTPSAKAVATAPSAPTVAPTAQPQTAAPTARPPTLAPTATKAPVSAKPLTMNSPEYGVQAFLWWRPEVASRDLGMIHDAGFGWVKVGFGWRDIEGAGKGQFDWSRTDRIVQQATELGLDLLVRVDHQPAWTGGGFPTNGPPNNLQDLADFFTALATRYRGRIRAYQVWNEPNLAREWGDKLPDPIAYNRMLKASYAAIKSADPQAMVISAGLTPTGSWDATARPDDWYLETMYVDMGGKSQGYFDVLGAHAPGYKSPPERDPAEVANNPDLGGHRAFCFRRIEDLRAIMVKYGDAQKQIAILEFGWTSDPRPDSPYNWHAVSEQVKADYLVRAYRYAKEHWSPWIGLMSLIYVADPDWTATDEQYWWSLNEPAYPEFKARPAYQALKAMPK